MMLMVLSMAPLHSLGQDDHNEVQHYIFADVTPLAMPLVSGVADGIVNGTIAVLRSR